MSTLQHILLSAKSSFALFNCYTSFIHSSIHPFIHSLIAPLTNIDPSMAISCLVNIEQGEGEGEGRGLFYKCVNYFNLLLIEVLHDPLPKDYVFLMQLRGSPISDILVLRTRKLLSFGPLYRELLLRSNRNKTMQQRTSLTMPNKSRLCPFYVTKEFLGRCYAPGARY